MVSPGWLEQWGGWVGVTQRTSVKWVEIVAFNDTECSELQPHPALLLVDVTIQPTVDKLKPEHISYYLLSTPCIRIQLQASDTAFETPSIPEWNDTGFLAAFACRKPIGISWWNQEWWDIYITPFCLCDTSVRWVFTLSYTSLIRVYVTSWETCNDTNVFGHEWVPFAWPTPMSHILCCIILIVVFRPTTGLNQSARGCYALCTSRKYLHCCPLFLWSSRLYCTIVTVRHVVC